MPPNDAARVRGFTRTELAAVIAALLVVAGLALPLLALSNNGSSRAVCFNNLRQMGLAMSMYAGDNRDYLAFCNWDGGDAPGPGWIYGPGPPPPAYHGLLPPSMTNSATSTNYGWQWQEGLWFHYINDPAPYLCPVGADYLKLQANRLSTYRMDGAGCGFTEQPYCVTCKINQIWSPACFLLWEPNVIGMVAEEFSFADGAVYPGEGENLATLHTRNGSEILCVGGNVTFVTTNDFATGSMGQGPGPGGKTLGWWSPFSTNGH